MAIKTSRCSKSFKNDIGFSDKWSGAITAATVSDSINNICSEGEAIFTKFIYEISDEAAVVNVFGKSLVPDMIADASIIEHN